MSDLPADPFLRGLLPGLCWDDGSRLPPAQRDVLPVDTVAAATVPAGVHLAVSGTATALEIAVRRGGPGTVPGPALPPAFVAVTGTDAVVTPLPAVGERVTVALPARAGGATVRVYLPEHERVALETVRPVGGTAAPAAPAGPRWVLYGDSITHGWSATMPHRTWPVRLAARFGLDLVNLGFAGSARGELPAASVVASSGADVVTLSWGTNAWRRVPTDRGLIAETMRVFLTALRVGLPSAPVLVVSPVVRPDAETTPNDLGATLADLRAGIESAVTAFGDPRVSLLPGAHLLDAADLVDGVHPGDAGHARLADAVAPWLAAALSGVEARHDGEP